MRVITVFDGLLCKLAEGLLGSMPQANGFTRCALPAGSPSEKRLQPRNVNRLSPLTPRSALFGLQTLALQRVTVRYRQLAVTVGSLEGIGKRRR